MSFQEMVAEIPKLSFAERVSLLASLTESFRAEMPARSGSWIQCGGCAAY